MISFALYASVVVVYKRNGIISQNVLYSVNIFTFVYHDKVKHTIMAVIIRLEFRILRSYVKMDIFILIKLLLYMNWLRQGVTTF